MGLIDSILHPEGANFTVLFMFLSCLVLQLNLTHTVTDQHLGQSAVDTMKPGNFCKISSGSVQQVFYFFIFYQLRCFHTGTFAPRFFE